MAFDSNLLPKSEYYFTRKFLTVAFLLASMNLYAKQFGIEILSPNNNVVLVQKDSTRIQAQINRLAHDSLATVKVVIWNTANSNWRFELAHWHLQQHTNKIDTMLMLPASFPEGEDYRLEIEYFPRLTGKGRNPNNFFCYAVSACVSLKSNIQTICKDAIHRKDALIKKPTQ